MMGICCEAALDGAGHEGVVLASVMGNRQESGRRLSIVRKQAAHDFN